MSEFEDNSNAMDAAVDSAPVAADAVPEVGPGPSPERPQHLRGTDGRFAKPLEAPHSWPADIRAKYWSGLHPDLQSYFAKTEPERHRAITEAGERAKRYEPFERLATQYGDQLSKYNLTPDRAFEYLLSAHQQLEANPMDGIMQIAASYGVDLSSLFKGDDGVLQQQVTQAEQRASVLERQLYDAARALNDTRTDFQKFKEETANKAHAAEAARAGRVNVRSSPAGIGGAKTMDDTLQELGRQYYG